MVRGNYTDGYKNYVQLLLIFLSFLSVVIGNWFIFVYAPVEKVLGLPQKIFYFHVSFAWWALFSFFLVCVFSFLYLLRKKLIYHIISRCCAEVGVVYASMVLCTGIIWARASWNTYWTWDPKLITTLIMWFMYVLYLVILQMDLPQETKYVISSMLGIIAFLDVPLVFWSARMWRSIHPAVFASKGGGMPVEMIYTLMVNLIAYGLLFFCLLLFRLSQVRLKHRIYHIIERRLY
jgi:heme exporter protein C